MVLIVEDETVSRRALQQLLRLCGYDAEAAGSGEEAMQMLAAGHDPDVAIVDINLPGMNGVEFVRRLRCVHPAMPCVFVTANEEEGAEQSRNSDRDPTLRKPFDVRSLLHLIHEAPGARN